MANKTDILIVGGGLNGLAAAVAFAGPAALRPPQVVLADARDPRNFANQQFDGRASAITASSRRMLEVMGVWERVAKNAEPMREIAVTDSKLGAAARPILLHFLDAQPGHEPSAYMIENRFLYAALLETALASPNIDVRSDTKIETFQFGPGLATLGLADGGSIQAPLIVAADGRNSPARQAAHIDVVGWPYGQTAIVTTVAHEMPHNGRAEEHFLPPGPFAILPLPGNRSSIVWTEEAQKARQIMALDDAGFAGELAERFGTHLGRIRIEGPHHSYPLGLYLAKEFTGERLALVGDSAHVIHPIAGLGLNLGFRDIAALAECVANAFALGLDIGCPKVLNDYASWRRFDTAATAVATDALNRLFANDNPVLRLVRDMGLQAVNALSPLKSYFSREASGDTGKLPRLLQGEPV
jgi:2-octaprenyl-6-methoxyphenol hydroxylase